MGRAKWLAAASLTGLLISGPVWPQRGSGVEGAGGRPGGRPMPRLDLKPGDFMPDVKLFTGEGVEIRTTQLKGSHTVLVFGCLT